MGRLKEVTGVFSQWASIEELENNIREAYALVIGEEAPAPLPARTREIRVEM